jgi:RsiW-degrading membrane proteinase PrsW (M82 family)/ribosomal protein L40E
MTIYIISFLLTILFWLWIILKYDRFEREPLKTVVFVFVIGGLISIIPAAILNYMAGQMIQYQSENGFTRTYDMDKVFVFFGFVGINEEFWKVAATVLLVRKMKAFNEPADALVYAMTVAFGFSVIENIEYTLKLGLAGFFIRQLNAVPLHIGLAAIWGVGIAKAKFINHGKYFLTLIPYLLLAAFLHFIYNMSTVLDIYPALNLIIPSIIAYFLIRFAIKKIRRYSQDGPFSNRLYCHHCNTVNFPDARICKKCGQAFKLEFYELCSDCNSRVPKQALSCPKCGKELTSQVV